ncbi:MAG: HAD family phosphatase [Phycisphaeraceae bacterium]|nr:MAG: HAD family phosphatase [Phycisphaeraceae bacterium]
MHHEPRQFDAVLCDIDGCLGPESTAPFDAHALARLADHNRRAAEHGDRPLVTLCSGRPQPFAEALCRVIHNHSLPVVCENGVWLFDPASGAYLRDPAITPEHLDAVAGAEAWIESQFGPTGVVIQPGKVASVSIWHPDTPFLMSLIPRLREVFADHGWPFRVSNTVRWINCDLAFVSKGTGVERFSAHTGIPRERLAGIGDTLSDLAIADRVVFFACPDNADEALKAKATYVAPVPEIAGVLHILDRLAAGRV